MLFNVSILLLLFWLVGISGVYNVGDLVHVLLLIGLMLLAVLRSRDAAARRPTNGSTIRS